MRRATVRYAFAAFARSWRRNDPEPISGDTDFTVFEKLRRFEQLVSRAVGEELISPVRAAELLNQSRDTVDQRITGPGPSGPRDRRRSLMYTYIMHIIRGWMSYGTHRKPGPKGNQIREGDV